MGAGSLFVFPDPTVFTASRGAMYRGRFATYSHYNYLRPGLIARIKRSRFETVLKLVAPYFGGCNALDFGCADGIFLPSLSRHFNSVVGIDRHPPFVETAQELVDLLHLPNVSLLCNAGISFDEVQLCLPHVEGDYSVAFLLETLEHVGECDCLYESKADFLEQLLSLLAEDGRVIISVPKMVGLEFLAKHIVQTVVGQSAESISLSNLLRASFLARIPIRWRRAGLAGTSASIISS